MQKYEYDLASLFDDVITCDTFPRLAYVDMLSSVSILSMKTKHPVILMVFFTILKFPTNILFEIFVSYSHGWMDIKKNHKEITKSFHGILLGV